MTNIFNIKKNNLLTFDFFTMSGISHKESIFTCKTKLNDVAESTLSAGFVCAKGDGVAFVGGLDNTKVGDIVTFPGTLASGVIVSFTNTYAEAALLNDAVANEVTFLDKVVSTEADVKIKCTHSLLGTILNGIGVPLEVKKRTYISSLSENFIFLDLNLKPQPVSKRGPIVEPLVTGIFALDTLLPLGRGQRQLILGDRYSGKTCLAIDIMINQKNNFFSKKIFCIYVAIGKKFQETKNLADQLTRKNAFNHCVFICAPAGDRAAIQVLAPYTGSTLAEYFRRTGDDVLLVFDDLSQHAIAYRELSLILQRSPAREAYPGDIFYLHSRLLERSSRTRAEVGGGSITCLPIVETMFNLLEAFIPTNVISITDGQYQLEKPSDSGAETSIPSTYPLINFRLSVSRIGGKAQHNLVKLLLPTIKEDLKTFLSIEALPSSAKDELDDYVLALFDCGYCVYEFFNQNRFSPISLPVQLMFLISFKLGYVKKFPLKLLKIYKIALTLFLNTAGYDRSSVCVDLLSGKKASNTKNLDIFYQEVIAFNVKVLEGLVK